MKSRSGKHTNEEEAVKSDGRNPNSKNDYFHKAIEMKAKSDKRIETRAMLQRFKEEKEIIRSVEMKEDEITIKVKPISSESPKP